MRHPARPWVFLFPLRVWDLRVGCGAPALLQAFVSPWDRSPPPASVASPLASARLVGVVHHLAPTTGTGNGAGFMAYLPSCLYQEVESPGVTPGARPVPVPVPPPNPAFLALQVCRELQSLAPLLGGGRIQGSEAFRDIFFQGRVLSVGHFRKAGVCYLPLKARSSSNTRAADPGSPAPCLEVSSCGAISGLEITHLTVGLVPNFGDLSSLRLHPRGGLFRAVGDRFSKSQHITWIPAAVRGLS